MGVGFRAFFWTLPSIVIRCNVIERGGGVVPKCLNPKKDEKGERIEEEEEMYKGERD